MHVKAALLRCASLAGTVCRSHPVLQQQTMHVASLYKSHAAAGQRAAGMICMENALMRWPCTDAPPCAIAPATPQCAGHALMPWPCNNALAMQTWQ
jgi:hypothetical protein